MTRPIVFYPFLFAAYAVIGVYTTNANEIPLTQLVRPLIIALLITAVVFKAVHLFTRDAQRSGFITTLIIFWVFYFGHIDLFSSLSHAYRQIQGYRILTILLWTFLMVLLGSTGTWKRISLFRSLTVFLNVTSVIVIILPVVMTIQIAFQTSREAILIENWRARAQSVNLEPGDNAPDIYYIMVDGYGRSDILKKFYGFDNSSFTQFLRDKGFYLADSSLSNYTQTELSLPSLLNLEYINFLNRPLA